MALSPTSASFLTYTPDERVSPVYSPHKHVGGEEANGARQQAVDQARQEAVCKKEHARHEARDMQTHDVEPDAGEKDPEGRRAADEEGIPPPVVVLVFQVSKAEPSLGERLPHCKVVCTWRQW